MFLSHPVSTPQELQPLLSHNSSDTTKPLYLIFYASWCPDCTNADPTIQATFGDKAPADGRDAVSVMVGARETWKSPNNVFRQAPYNISNIPTILRMEGSKETARIVEGDILDEAKLSDFLQA